LLAAGVKSPAAKGFYDNSGTEAVTSTPDALAKFQQAETQKWGKVIKAAGIEAE
jgi:tripartite-type tricarboxylate transporter receptor subunit TctC